MKKTVLTSLLMAGLVGILIYLGWLRNNNNHDALLMNTTATNTPKRTSSADWTSDAITIEELVSESDLVVLVRVSGSPVTRVVPIYPLDQQGNRIESAAFPVLFSDTTFDVLKTYLGTSVQTVTVMQTGGYDPTVSKGVEEMSDDPLYKIGEEYILFLVNISGDPIHAPDRDLYIIVNTFGRYRLTGGHVSTYGQNPLRSVQLPMKFIDLETQIEQAKQSSGK